MKFVVTEDLKYLRLQEITQEELDQLELSFKKRIRGHFWNPLVKKKIWDGFVYFFKNNMIPSGLWLELEKMCTTYSFPLEINGMDRLIDKDFDEAGFRLWVEEFFSDHPTYKPRDYQIDSAVKILRFKISSSQIATSAGKTLIAFIVWGWLKHLDLKKASNKGTKMLIIVPNVTLVMQLKEDWDEYNRDKLPLKIRQVYGGSRDNDINVDVIVGTFQSLVRKTVNYFKGMDVIFVDEAHQAKTTSIKAVLSKCLDSEYRFGLSGTLQEDESADFWTVTALLGPVVHNISPKFLFKEGYATPVKFKIIVLQYKNEEIRKKLYNIRKSRQLEGSAILALEKNMVVQSRARFNFIVNLAKKTTKNTLILFSNVKDQYGKKLFESIKENTDKECFYVDGSVGKDQRDFFKKEMEEGSNRVLIASFTTFSTGISIKNIHNIIFVESYKSEIIVKQSIGRGMRQMAEGKDSFQIIDIVDDMCYEKSSNFLYKHAKTRLEYYKQYSTDITIHKFPI